MSCTRRLQESDPDQLERAAHALKSSSANLGALDLSALFRDIEAAGRSRDLARAASLVDRTTEEYGTRGARAQEGDRLSA